jgi:hypothetical protein
VLLAVSDRTVYYKGDPHQLPLRLAEEARDGWCLVEWPVGEGFTALDGSVKDGPFRHVASQVATEPFFEPVFRPSKKQLRRRKFA